MPRNSVPNSLGIPLQISSPTPGGQRFHPNWPDVDKIESFSLLTLLNYQSKKRRKQMESGCGTGITNHQKSVWNNFQYLKYELTSKSGGGTLKPPSPPQLRSFPFHSGSFWHPLRSAENITYRAKPSPSSRFFPCTYLFSTNNPYMTKFILGIDNFIKKSNYII